VSAYQQDRQLRTAAETATRAGVEAPPAGFWFRNLLYLDGTDWQVLRVGEEHTKARAGPDRQPPTLEFARRLARELQGVATVEIEDIEGGRSVSVTPTNPNACAFVWADFSDGLVIQVGEYGGRWELEAAPEDVALLEDIARSVIAGRVREVRAPVRSAVSVRLADGSLDTEIGSDAPVGCLPLPFWRRWSRSIQYAPYR
jgi:hypothetical protein